jgi:hypothetical protein
MNKKTVILTGLFYPMAILRYYESALKRRDDIDLITVGPYFGNMIPWNNWMALPQKYAIAPTITLPQGSVTVPISFIENQLPQEADLWLQIDAGFYLEGRPQNGKNKSRGTSICHTPTIQYGMHQKSRSAFLMFAYWAYIIKIEIYLLTG